MDHAGQGRLTLRRLAPLVGVTLFAAALAVLHQQLRDVRYQDLRDALAELPRGRVLFALVLTAANYVALSCYDQLAFTWLRHELCRGWVALAGFVGYAISNSLGFGMLSGAAVRLRFYTRWGVSAADLSRIVLFQSTTFWLGLLALGGWAIALTPHPWLRALPGAPVVRGVGLAMLVLAASYAALPLLRRAPLRVRQLEVPVPSLPIAVSQFLLSMVDWTLAAAVLQALLPPSRVPFGELLGAFLAAQVVGLVSHVPGGLGVFETLMVLALAPYLPASAVLPALLLYRFVYYLLPLALALSLLLVEEARERRDHIARLGGALHAFFVAIAPRLLAAFTFVAGAVLLFSGAMPSAPGRLRWLGLLLPLPVVEISHFVASLVGLGLLVASRGVWRRLDAAYYVAIAGLALGISLSLLKGAAYEEAILLALLLVAFVPTRPAFDRRAAFFDGRISPGWLLAILAVVGASVWLGFFSFKHVEYSHDLWWRFELDADAPRFLRASVGVMVGLLCFGAVRLLRPAAPELPLPTDADLADAERVIAGQDHTMAHLALMRDKALLFDDARTAFVMYGVAGPHWVALGDPVGPASAHRELIRRFLGRCDDYAGRPIFYQLAKDHLHQYADFGLTFVKLGEEARVRLAGFTLEGPARKPFRNAIRRAEREGACFRVVAREQVPELMRELRAVSDDWLAQRGASEKAFSLGFFDEDYVRRFPVAVIEQAGQVAAFATVWELPSRAELSVDLMRHRQSAPKYAMELLFTHLLLWGQKRGYGWLALGMAPLSGLEASPVATLWSKLGRLVYNRGGSFYNFQGLRAFKEKFDPVWEPRYLAYPGGVALPRVMADIAALIAGGYARIFR